VWHTQFTIHFFYELRETKQHAVEYLILFIKSRRGLN